MSCEAEKENVGAGTTCLIAASAGTYLAPGWWKLAFGAGILSCLLWIDSARRQLEDCMRNAGKHAEADILKTHGDQIATEVAYLQSLGFQAA